MRLGRLSHPAATVQVYDDGVPGQPNLPPTLHGAGAADWTGAEAAQRTASVLRWGRGGTREGRGWEGKVLQGVEGGKI